MVPSSLDCSNGLKCCDYECEYRHLDVVEQRQRIKLATSIRRKENQPNLIVTASPDMGRTASTWLFNAVRLLHRQANEFCDSYWIRELSRDKLQRRTRHSSTSTTAASRPCHVVVKTHEIETSQQYFDQEVLPLLTHIIVSVRDGFPADPKWMQVATLVVKYEDIVADNPNSDVTNGALSVLRRLANHLNLPSNVITDDDLRTVDYDLMTLQIPGDQSTKFWPFHSRRGGRATPAPRLFSSLTSQASTALDATYSSEQQGRREQIDPKIVSIRGGGHTEMVSTADVFVTRHGARIDNGPDRDSNWLQMAGHGRRQDAYLSPMGHIAASQLASEFIRRQAQQPGLQNRVLDHIVSSPFLRCMETAEAVARSLNLKIKVEPGIAEVGADSTQMASQAELEQRFASTIDRDYIAVMSREELPGKNGGEFGDGAAARRAGAVAQTIQRRLGRNKSILFVGHGASCLGLVQAFGGEGYIGYCSLTHFQWSPAAASTKNVTIEGGEWRLLGRLGDVSHLSDKQTALDSAW